MLPKISKDELSAERAADMLVGFVLHGNDGGQMLNKDLAGLFSAYSPRILVRAAEKLYEGRFPEVSDKLGPGELIDLAKSIARSDRERLTAHDVIDDVLNSVYDLSLTKISNASPALQAVLTAFCLERFGDSPAEKFRREIGRVPFGRLERVVCKM